MSEAKFTKGPWKITESKLQNKIIIEGDNYVISDVNDPTMNEDIANAHLIAAAPEMYEALLYLIPLIKELHNITDHKLKLDNVAYEINLLLAKARGENQ